MALPPLPAWNPSIPSIPLGRGPLRKTPAPIESEPLLARLQEATLGTGPHSRELLDRVAEAALGMTKATGVAIALRHAGRVVCAARSGANVPDLGAPLCEDSGLSGLCLRLGKTMISEETLTDARVDGSLCRHLGIRSIIALPLRLGETTIGLIEAFSNRAGAFSQDHIDFLQFVASLIESSGNVARINRAAPRPVRPVVTPRLQPGDSSNTSLQYGKKTTPKMWYGLAIFGLSVFGSVAWAAWHYAPEAQENPRPAAIQTTIPESNANPPVSFTTEVMSVGPSVRSGLAPEEITQPSPVGIPANAVEPAVIPARLTPSKLRSVPSFDPSAAEALVRSVAPIYPPEAQKRGIYGIVILRALITEDGGVESVEVVQGNPILAHAAMDAARQWRYRPLLSDGKPARSEANITIRFNRS